MCTTREMASYCCVFSHAHTFDIGAYGVWEVLELHYVRYFGGMSIQVPWTSRDIMSQTTGPNCPTYSFRLPSVTTTRQVRVIGKMYS